VYQIGFSLHDYIEMHGQKKLFLCVVCGFSTYVFGELLYILYIYILLFVQHNGDVPPEKKSCIFIELLGYPERVFVVFFGLTVKFQLNSPRQLS